VIDPLDYTAAVPPDVASRDTNVAIVVREAIALLAEGKKLGLK